MRPSLGFEEAMTSMTTVHVFTATLLCLSMARGLAFAEPPEATDLVGEPTSKPAVAPGKPSSKPGHLGVGADTSAGPAGADVVGKPIGGPTPHGIPPSPAEVGSGLPTKKETSAMPTQVPGPSS